MKIPFEIHLTVSAVTEDMSEGFEQVCRKLGGKAILIELARGDYLSQPMFSTVISAGNLDQALNHAEVLTQNLSSEQYTVSRIKIETPSQYAAYFSETDRKDFAPYYEWHGKVNYENAEALTALALLHQAHLSRNALKDDTGRRYITLREFEGKATFAKRVAALSEGLQSSGWQILKQESEYCVYDSHRALDSGWLTPA